MVIKTVITGIFTCVDIALTKLNIDYYKRKIIIGRLIYSKTISH